MPPTGERPATRARRGPSHFCDTPRAALLSTGAHADGLIAGATVGQAHLNVGCTGTAECKDNTTGVKLMGGYKWDNGFAVEVSYVDFGKFSASFPATNVPGVGSVTPSVDVKPYAIGVSGAYYAPVAADWQVSVRLGIASVRTSADFNVSAPTSSVSLSGGTTSTTQALAGIGVSYMINQAASVDLAFDATRAEYSNPSLGVDDTKATARLVSLGLTYRF